MMFDRILVVILLLASATNGEIGRQTKSTKRHRSIVGLFFSKKSDFDLNLHNKSGACDWLHQMKHQMKLCRKRKGLAEILWNARSLAKKYCVELFRYEQWNCSTKNLFFKKIYRETAFMYSLTSSALMYSIAKGCSAGKLAGCKCAEHGLKRNNSEWQWGGCGDNSRYAKRFTKKFFQSKKFNDDFPNTVLQYNAKIGLKIVGENIERKCRCHGVSGSCTMRICWKQIRSFDKIVLKLKNFYHNALKIESKNSPRPLEMDKNLQKLVYLENSPNFCPSTVNRLCKDADNCATLCCGRGFYSHLVDVVERCNCRWHTDESYKIHCQQCKKSQLVYNCE